MGSEGRRWLESTQWTLLLDTMLDIGEYYWQAQNEDYYEHYETRLLFSLNSLIIRFSRDGSRSWYIIIRAYSYIQFDIMNIQQQTFLRLNLQCTSQLWQIYKTKPKFSSTYKSKAFWCCLMQRKKKKRKSAINKKRVCVHVASWESLILSAARHAFQLSVLRRAVTSPDNEHISAAGD